MLLIWNASVLVGAFTLLLGGSIWLLWGALMLLTTAVVLYNVHLLQNDTREEPDQIYVQMTPTTPGCPLHGTIVGAVRWTLTEHTGQSDIHIDLVWEPQWSPAMMSNEARESLGYL